MMSRNMYDDWLYGAYKPKVPFMYFIDFDILTRIDVA